MRRGSRTPGARTRPDWSDTCRRLLPDSTRPEGECRTSWWTRMVASAGVCRGATLVTGLPRRGMAGAAAARPGSHFAERASRCASLCSRSAPCCPSCSLAAAPRRPSRAPTGCPPGRRRGAGRRLHRGPDNRVLRGRPERPRVRRLGRPGRVPWRPVRVPCGHHPRERVLVQRDRKLWPRPGPRRYVHPQRLELRGPRRRPGGCSRHVPRRLPAAERCKLPERLRLLREVPRRHLRGSDPPGNPVHGRRFGVPRRADVRPPGDLRRGDLRVERRLPPAAAVLRAALPVLRVHLSGR